MLNDGLLDEARQLLSREGKTARQAIRSEELV